MADRVYHAPGVVDGAAPDRVSKGENILIKPVWIVLAGFLAAAGSGCKKDCTKDEACARAGDCTNKDGKCVASSDADCQKSATCGWSGMCSLVGDVCAPTTAEHCRASKSCAQKATCGYNAEKHRCEPSSPADCKQSEACKTGTGEAKACRFDADRRICVGGTRQVCADPEGESCRIRGQCHDHGSASAKMRDGELVQETNVACVAKTDADCRASEDCREYGRCSVTPTGSCIISKPEDCQGSDLCRNEGRCSPGQHDGSPGCVVGSAADCARTCPITGLCGGGTGLCMATDDAMCAAASNCKDLGTCGRSAKYSECEPRSLADCQASAICKKENKCRWVSRVNDSSECNL